MAERFPFPVFDQNTPEDYQRLRYLTQDFPRFSEEDELSGIDYRNTEDAVIVTAAVAYGDETLLTRRAEHVAANQNMVTPPAGFMNEIVPAVEVVVEELQEELGIPLHEIACIGIAKLRLRPDPGIKRRWHEFRTLVELKKQVEPKLNNENREAFWLPIAEIGTQPNMLRSARVTQLSIFALRQSGKLNAFLQPKITPA